jgi:hypothetical protein
MHELKSTRERIRRQLEIFAVKSGIGGLRIRPRTDFIKETGFTSLQGLEFVLELCDEFQFDFPADFNPFVDDERRRGQTFDGLVKAIELHLASEGASNAKK